MAADVLKELVMSQYRGNRFKTAPRRMIIFKIRSGFSICLIRFSIVFYLPC